MALGDVGGRGGGGARETREAHEQGETSLEALAASAMADGAVWAVSDVYAAIIAKGVKVDRPTINSILWRGSRRAGGKFQLVSRGRYRVKMTAKAKEESFPR